MTFVFVLDSDRTPLDPCHPARARQLLHQGRASVLRRYPFTIILHDRPAVQAQAQQPLKDAAAVNAT